MNAQVGQLRRRLNSTQELLDRLSQYVAGTQLGETDRERTTRLLWQQVIEDGLAIPLLIERRYTGSSRALLRPQLEALVRGAWAKLLATDADVQRFADGDFDPPGIASLIRRLSSLPWNVANQPVQLDELWQQAGDAFHDSAHRGTRVVARLAFANLGDLDYVGEDEDSILYLAGVCAGIAGTALLEDAGSADLARLAWESNAQFIEGW